MAGGNSKRVVYAALAGNLAIAATKFGAALLTGSSGMLSEAIHSTVDTGNQGLLLYGMRRAARPPDGRHPFGYGMEIYFWAFVVALLIFALGGAFSIYEGFHKIADPHPISSAWVNYAVVAAAFVFEGLSFRVAWREFRADHPGVPILSGIRRSKDPMIFAVLLEDGAALAGLVIAFAGIGLAEILAVPVLDGVASIGIGLLLIVVAAFLARETLSLLIGESASQDVLKAARSLLERDPNVVAVFEILSMHLGPREILLAVTLDMRDDVSGGRLEEAAADLASRIEQAHPEITRVFVRPRPHGAVRTDSQLFRRTSTACGTTHVDT
jgi:cation diffusion facilitator family transporter